MVDNSLEKQSKKEKSTTQEQVKKEKQKSTTQDETQVKKEKQGQLSKGKEATSEQGTRANKNKRKWFGIRRFPILLRIVVVFILLIVALLLGLIVGYGIIGDGNPTDVLHKDTWQHILDIVEKE